MADMEECSGFVDSFVGGFLIEGNKEALRHPWCLEKSEGERHGQNIFRKC